MHYDERDYIVKAFSDEYFKMIYELKDKRIYFFNGCFDIIHLGHIKMINKIKENLKVNWGSNGRIIAAINSNESYKKLNKSHPLVHDEMYRAKILISLGVNKVIIFDNENPLDVVMSLMPDKLFKGRDYYGIDYPEKPFIKSYGGTIEYLDLEKEDEYGKGSKYSSTDIYNAIANNVKQEIRESLQ
jgi:D-beta-D-heptose 7-phosphate kinase / D-beta-D-heptose 1-phosphate adenosyltransferase